MESRRGDPRGVLQRWTLLRNTMEATSEDRVMDAFMHGVYRRDLREEFGRLRPLMDLAADEFRKAPTVISIRQ